MFRDSHCYFSAMRLKSGGYGTPHSKKWGVRVPPVPVPPESYAYATKLTIYRAHSLILHVQLITVKSSQRSTRHVWRVGRVTSWLAPRPIALKLCHMIWNWLSFIMQVQKFGDPFPPPQKKNGGPKHAKFQSILYNLRYWNRSGKLSSTNYRDLDMSLDPLKCTYLGYYISALRGCCALKFLHVLQIDQSLLAHIGTSRGSPKKILIVKI